LLCKVALTAGLLRSALTAGLASQRSTMQSLAGEMLAQN
jgi:hypothetical protein